MCEVKKNILGFRLIPTVVLEKKSFGLYVFWVFGR